MITDLGLSNEHRAASWAMSNAKYQMENGKREISGLSSVPALTQHIAKQRSLLDRVIQGFVRVRQIVEPSPRHIPFDGVAEIDLEHGHSIGLDVERGMRERVYAGEAVQIPADEHIVEWRRIANKHRSAGKASQPVEIIVHRRFGRLKFSAACFPGFGLSLPPGHRLR